METSKLYQSLIQYYTQTEIDEQIIYKFEISKNDLYTFIHNYKNIYYNEQNIHKYLTLYIFLSLDNDFLEYIILKTQIPLLKLLSNEQIIINTFKNLCKKNNNISKSRFHIFFTHIYDLNLSNNTSLTNDDIKYMTHLTNLNLSKNMFITNEGIKNMNLLQELNLEENILITNDGIKNMSLIKNLNLNFNENIDDNGINHMTLLKNLHTQNTKYFIDKQNYKHTIIYNVKISKNI